MTFVPLQPKSPEEIQRIEDERASQKEINPFFDEKFVIPTKEAKIEQQKNYKDLSLKFNMEFKLSKNYNSVMLGIQDEPIVFGNEEQLRQEIRKVARILREEVEHQLSLIGTKE